MREEVMQGTIFVGGGGENYATPQRVALEYANRHGLIAGATGTGNTVTPDDGNIVALINTKLHQSKRYLGGAFFDL